MHYQNNVFSYSKHIPITENVIYAVNVVMFNPINITLCYNINILWGYMRRKEGNMLNIKAKILGILKEEKITTKETDLILDKVKENLHIKKGTVK